MKYKEIIFNITSKHNITHKSKGQYKDNTIHLVCFVAPSSQVVNSLTLNFEVELPGLAWAKLARLRCHIREPDQMIGLPLYRFPHAVIRQDGIILHATPPVSTLGGFMYTSFPTRTPLPKHDWIRDTWGYIGRCI